MTTLSMISCKHLSTDAVVIVSIIILVVLFSIQQFGTGRMGSLFAPILALWFFCLGSTGLYNLIKHDITVLRAVNPAYIYYFFRKNSGSAWSALGGCVLCITGIELRLTLANSKFREKFVSFYLFCSKFRIVPSPMGLGFSRQ